MKVILANSERGMRGGEYQTCALAAGLMEKDCRVTLISPPGAEIEDRVPAGVTLFHAGYELIPLKTPLAVRKLVRDSMPDIIHAQSSRAHTHMRAAATISGAFPPLVISRRVAFGISGGIAGLWKYRRGVARYIAVSDAAASKLREGGVEEDRIEVVRSGVDTANLAAARPEPVLAQRLGIRDNNLVIGTMAPFEKEKGYPTFLAVAERLSAEFPEARFIMLGTGSLEGCIRSYIGSSCLRGKASVVTDPVPVEKMLPLFDIFVLCSYREGLSTALVSAIAAGVPAVASDTGGIPEVLSGGAGILARPGNENDFHSSVRELIENPRKREELSMKGKHKAKEFDISETVERTYEIYRYLAREDERVDNDEY
ncbi:MAG: glycosyltransferase family 4 protein [Candidatus Krumholzibacteriales bacterium]